MLTGKYHDLYIRLEKIIPKDRLIFDDLRTLAYGTDASLYRYVPKLIVKVESEPDVIATLQACRDLGLAITFRAAGTSLSGQACTDSVLVMLGEKGWDGYSLSDDKSGITLQVGIRGGQANRYLAPYGKEIGPDPASIDSAKIGGIVANNACGMASGVALNSQYTLKDIRLIFADGTILDTKDAQSRAAFWATKKHWLQRLQQLIAGLKNDDVLLEKIRRKYRLKNTTGFSVNALIEHDDPIKIIQHLMVGSEGTLAFISDVTFRTIDVPSQKATSLILFPDIATACQAVLILRHCQVFSAELMDRVALRTVQGHTGLPDYINDMGEKVTALLVETGANDLSSLKRNISEIQEKLKCVKLAHEYTFTSDPGEIEALWKVRKGIFPCACSEREAGTAVIIEDIAVPVESLQNCLQDLQLLFEKYGYSNCVIWGHVFDGNVHFVLTPDFSREEEVQRYKKFMFEMADLIVGKFSGSLKAEHGTGRNMAPFVEKEWGPEIYAVMREIKKIFDPDNILNPGVVLSDDQDIFVKNFKPMPSSSKRIDACIECGFCERYCMSNGFTLSPRQRIIVWREIQRLKHEGGLDGKKEKVLEDMFNYYGDKTCAADGLCSIGCPLNIDVGALIKDLRHEGVGFFSNYVAASISRNMATVTSAARHSLKLVNRLHGILGTSRMMSLAKICRKLSGNRLPLWNSCMPTGAEKVRNDSFCHENSDSVVYLPSCISRTFGPARDYDTFSSSLPQTTENLLRKAGYQVIYPQNLHNLCCGLAFENKGFKSIAGKKAKELEEALISASRHGKIPILCDTSPCLYHMKANLDPCLKLYDPVEFTMAFLAERLRFIQLPETIALHATCSVKKMALESQLVTLAKMCAKEVIFPDMICCGFAGDKGFTQPELNAFGLRNLKKEIPEEVTAGYSTSRTCEIGLSLQSGIPYKSILYLVDQATHSKG